MLYADEIVLVRESSKEISKVRGLEPSLGNIRIPPL